MNKFRLALVSTGGTIEKTYDELDGLPSELPLLSAEDVMAMDEADDV